MHFLCWASKPSLLLVSTMKKQREESLLLEKNRSLEPNLKTSKGDEVLAVTASLFLSRFSWTLYKDESLIEYSGIKVLVSQKARGFFMRRFQKVEPGNSSMGDQKEEGVTRRLASIAGLETSLFVIHSKSSIRWKLNERSHRRMIWVEEGR